MNIINNVPNLNLWEECTEYQECVCKMEAGQLRVFSFRKDCIYQSLCHHKKYKKKRVQIIWTD